MSPNLSEKDRAEIVRLLNENLNRDAMYEETKKRNAKGIKGRYVQDKKGCWVWRNP